MTAERRRFLIQQLFEREAAGGHAVDDTAEFISLVGLWVRDIDMPAFRNRYRSLREERLHVRRSEHTQPRAATDQVEDVSEPDDLLAEIERMAASLRSA